uniref:FAD/NAD(P)-binding domain-containing protein n=1 Tax=Ditylenchus dipsaci TaxID=166011 RepID=A0A915CZ49_9BILA
MFRNSRRIFSSWRFCSVPYVLIGGGTASYYAALTIRARDPEAKVLIISEENESPYNRQLLSKEVWWYGNENTPKSLSYISPASGKRRDLPYESDGFYPKLEDFSSEIDATTSSEYSHGGIALLKNSKAVKVDSEKHWVELMDGKKISFKKCLLATGSRLKDLDVLDKSDSRKAELKKSISKFTNVDDYRNLDAVIKSKMNSRIGIVGGGFLGSELAYSLNRRYGQDQKKRMGLV